jgi:hypothetical protein
MKRQLQARLRIWKVRRRWVHSAQEPDEGVPLFVWARIAAMLITCVTTWGLVLFAPLIAWGGDPRVSRD